MCRLAILKSGLSRSGQRVFSLAIGRDMTSSSGARHTSNLLRRNILSIQSEEFSIGVSASISAVI
jgi:hypothetical protein